MNNLRCKIATFYQDRYSGVFCLPGYTFGGYEYAKTPKDVVALLSKKQLKYYCYEC